VTDQGEKQVPDEELSRSRQQVASGRSATFCRGFQGLNAVANAVASGDHWFIDLLSLWRPSGQPSGQWGLRLALRDGYMNFYRKGQSIARVKHIKGELVCFTHGKYASGARDFTGQAYARTVGRTTTLAAEIIPYNGLDTLKRWISRVNGDHEHKGYIGLEKQLVDEVVAVNDNVIDLEMALPAWALQASAPRIDLVAVHEGRLVFWEVKLPGDSRVRSSVTFQADHNPEVLKQLRSYKIFLEQSLHIEQIASAYRQTARLLVILRSYADQVSTPAPLGKSITATAEGNNLTVAKEAVLLVVSDGDNETSSWLSWKRSHEVKLLDSIPMQVMLAPNLLKVPDRLDFR